VHSTAWFAVAWPDGPRLDMGLIDCVVLAGITVLLYVLARKPRHQGVLMGVLGVTYCVIRFFLDFLRARDLSFVDGRILGLTPAQWITPVLAAIALYLLVTARRFPLVTVAAPPPVAPDDRGGDLSAKAPTDPAESGEARHAPEAR
jgi:phosphatidylglycerol:prolipoprotein diacylglycerol transferase